MCTKIRVMLNRALCVFLIFFTVSGCTAEGNSQHIGKGETTYFLTMSACEKEALSEYESGGKKYAGYECKKILFGLFQLEHKTY